MKIGLILPFGALSVCSDSGGKFLTIDSNKDETKGGLMFNPNITK